MKNNGWFKKGNKLSKKTIEKIRKYRIGKSSGMLGKKHNLKTLEKMKKAAMGEKNNKWKGGISKEKFYTKDWKEKNWERVLSYNRKRRVMKFNNGGFHTLSEWETLKAQYNWTCPSCKKSEPAIILTEDHIIPLSKGGSDNIENIQPLCKSCNCRKNNKIIKYVSNKK